MLETRVLRYFLAVAQEGSITGAAHSLHVTQPTLSRQLMDLEAELGQSLFVRNSHSITLTQEGIFLRKRAEEILELIGKTEAEFTAIGETVAGNIHIGCGETDAMNLIAVVIREMREEYPEVRFNIFSGNARDVMERLDEGMLDFGILIQPVDIGKYNVLNLPAKDVWGVIMRKDSPLARKEKITRADLKNIPLLCSRQTLKGNSVRNPYREWFGENWESLNVVATYNLIYNAALLVKNGLGYAITLDKLVNTTVHSDLKFVPFSPRLESKLDIVWKKSQIFSPAAELFLKKLQAKFKNKIKSDDKTSF